MVAVSQESPTSLPLTWEAPWSQCRQNWYHYPAPDRMWSVFLSSLFFCQSAQLSKPVLHQLSFTGSRIYNLLFAWLGGIWESKLVKVWISFYCSQLSISFKLAALHFKSTLYHSRWWIFDLFMVIVLLVTVSPFLSRVSRIYFRYSMEKNAQYTVSATQHITVLYYSTCATSWLLYIVLRICWKYT